MNKRLLFVFILLLLALVSCQNDDLVMENSEEPSVIKMSYQSKRLFKY